MDEKICIVCQISKPLSDFYIYRNTFYQIRCKDCVNMLSRERWQQESENSLFKVNRRAKSRIWYNNHHKSFLLAHSKRRAKLKNIPFNITEEDILIPEFCPYLGIPVFKGNGKVCDNSPSIDEIIQGKGYVKGNIQTISNKANSMKRNATIEELLCFAKKILEQFGEK